MSDSLSVLKIFQNKYYSTMGGRGICQFALFGFTWQLGHELFQALTAMEEIVALFIAVALLQKCSLVP